VAVVTIVLWFAMGVGFLVYGFATGKHANLGGIPVWPIFFGIGVLRLAMWYAARINKEDEEAKRITEEARRRQARERDRSLPYDPTFDFNRPDEPKQPN
jgi:hypothetical protein